MIIRGGGGRGDGVVRSVLVVDFGMVVLAVANGGCVMGRRERAVFDTGCSRRQLQTCALPPGRRAGDERKRDSQSQYMTKSTTHRTMLAGLHDGRQQFFGAITFCSMIRLVPWPAPNFTT